MPLEALRQAVQVIAAVALLLFLQTSAQCGEYGIRRFSLAGNQQSLEEARQAGKVS